MTNGAQWGDWRGEEQVVVEAEVDNPSHARRLLNALPDLGTRQSRTPISTLPDFPASSEGSMRRLSANGPCPLSTIQLAPPYSPPALTRLL